MAFDVTAFSILMVFFDRSVFTDEREVLRSNHSGSIKLSGIGYLPKSGFFLIIVSLY